MRPVRPPTATKKSGPSYAHAPPRRPNLPGLPPKTAPPATARDQKSYLNSYANAAIETKISYEKSISSYDFGRIPSCRRPHTRPQTILTQLRQETKNPYLNSYERETTETGKKEPVLYRLPYSNPCLQSLTP